MTRSWSSLYVCGNDGLVNGASFSAVLVMCWKKEYILPRRMQTRACPREWWHKSLMYKRVGVVGSKHFARTSSRCSSWAACTSAWYGKDIVKKRNWSKQGTSRNKIHLILSNPASYQMDISLALPVNPKLHSNQLRPATSHQSKQAYMQHSKIQFSMSYPNQWPNT